MIWARIALGILGFLSSLVALLRSQRDRIAGWNEAVARQKEVSDEAIEKALAARRARRAGDLEPDRLREDDGFRRD